MAHDPADISVKELENGRLLSEGESGTLPDSDQPLITPMETAWLLWENRRRVFRVCLTGLIIFTLIAFAIPKKYKSTARLMPPDFNTSTLMSLALPVLGSQGSTGGGMGGGSVMGLASQLLGMNSSGNLFIGVLRSRTIEDKIISQFDLQKRYSNRYIEDTRARLEESTDIQIDKKSGILSISVEDTNPERARAMAQAYVEELGKVLTAANSSAAHRERMFIENRLAEVKDDLDKSSKEFSLFSSQNSAINLPEQAKAMVGAAAQMQGQLITAQAEMRGLEQIYTGNNIRVREAKARVAELQDQVNKFAGKGVDPSRDTSLAAGELYPSVRQLPLLGVKYLDLYRQNKIDETVYELLTKQYEVAKIQEARENPSVQVLDAPDTPQKKSFPHRLWIMLAGLLLSFLAVTAWILGDFVWQRIDPKDPRRVLGASVFAQIQAILWDSKWARRLRRKFTRPSSDGLPERS